MPHRVLRQSLSHLRIDPPTVIFALAEELKAKDSDELSRRDRAVKASQASKATKCPLCMLLVEDLWAKVLGQGIEDKPMATEDQIFDMIDKTCGSFVPGEKKLPRYWCILRNRVRVRCLLSSHRTGLGGRPVPFRGAYELTEKSVDGKPEFSLLRYVILPLK
eukprot:SAG31_NODE_1986_length_6725_cov_3.779505_2_plen_162_part_00